MHKAFLTPTFFRPSLLRFLGFSGYLKPLDGIKPYRMELLCAPGSSRLDKFWSPLISPALADEMGAEEGLLFDLASKEYSALVGDLPPKVRRVTVDFTVAGVAAPSAKLKQSRGLFARFFCEGKVGSVEEARGFDKEGYGCEVVEEVEGGWRMVFDRSVEDSRGGKKGGSKKRKKGE